MADLREALKGNDAERHPAKTQTLTQASMKLGEAMYKQAAEQQPGGGGGGGEGAGGAEAKKDDVVDAEFTEVDDDKKTRNRLDRSFDAATSLQIRTPARKTGVRIFFN